MTAISLNLPDDLAHEAKRLSERMGISRTELIRQAIRHELDQIQAKFEREGMIKAFQAMRDDPAYRQDSEDLETALSDALGEEKDTWWQS